MTEKIPRFALDFDLDALTLLGLPNAKAVKPFNESSIAWLNSRLQRDEPVPFDWYYYCQSLAPLEYLINQRGEAPRLGIIGQVHCTDPDRPKYFTLGDTLDVMTVPFGDAVLSRYGISRSTIKQYAVSKGKGIAWACWHYLLEHAPCHPIEIAIVEGLKKAAYIQDNWGIPTLAITGCENGLRWSIDDEHRHFFNGAPYSQRPYDKTYIQSRRLMPTLEWLVMTKLRERVSFTLVSDSDCRNNVDVQRGWGLLYHRLRLFNVPVTLCRPKTTEEVTNTQPTQLSWVKQADTGIDDVPNQHLTFQDATIQLLPATNTGANEMTYLSSENITTLANNTDGKPSHAQMQMEQLTSKLAKMKRMQVTDAAGLSECFTEWIEQGFAQIDNITYHKVAYFDLESSFFGWTGSYWRPLSTQMMQAMCQRFLIRFREDNPNAHKLKLSMGVVTGVLEWYKSATLATATVSEKMSEGISVQNGYIDKSGKLLPPNPDNYNTSTASYSVTTEPVKTLPPNISKLLDHLTEGDRAKRDIILAYWRAVLLGITTRYGKCLTLLGVGGCGKSTLIDAIAYSVGTPNVQASTLHRLNNSPFEPATLSGKKLVVCGDESRVHGDCPMIKKIITGDLIPFERKGKDTILGRFTGGFLIACHNSVFQDVGSAIERRLLVIRCTRQISPENRDIYLADRINDEMGDIVSYLLNMDEEQCHHILLEHQLEENEYQRAENDSVYAFVTECLEKSDTSYEAAANGAMTNLIIPVGDRDRDGTAYKQYCIYCASQGYSPVKVKRFISAIEDLHTKYTYLITRELNGDLVLCNVKFTKSHNSLLNENAKRGEYLTAGKPVAEAAAEMISAATGDGGFL